MPILDLFIRHIIEQYLQYLSKNPDVLDEQFRFASKDTVEDMKRLVRDFEIKVRSGYPREKPSLPCIIVLIDNEMEEAHGLGYSIDTGYDDLDDNYLNWSKEEDNFIKENTQMKTSIRCEAWSDNAVVTSFLYSIIKLALLTTRFQMTNEGVMMPELSGGDLEPVQEYITDTFVYRKAVIMNCSYEIDYYVQELIAGKPNSQFNLGTTINQIDIGLDGTYGGTDGEKDNNEKNS